MHTWECKINLTADLQKRPMQVQKGSASVVYLFNLKCGLSFSWKWFDTCFTGHVHSWICVNCFVMFKLVLLLNTINYEIACEFDRLANSIN